MAPDVILAPHFNLFITACAQKARDRECRGASWKQGDVGCQGHGNAGGVKAGVVFVLHSTTDNHQAAQAHGMMVVCSRRIRDSNVLDI